MSPFLLCAVELGAAFCAGRVRSDFNALKL